MQRIAIRSNRPVFQKRVFLAIVLLFAISGTYLLFSARALTTYSPPGSIAQDCSVDVTNPASSSDTTTNLQAWFNSLPNDSIINLPTNACYNTEYPFSIVSRSNITINGNGATFQQKTDGSGLTYSGKDTVRTRGSVRILDSSLITINSLKLKGTRTGAYTGCYNANLEAQHGFNVAGSSNTTLNNVTVNDVWGDFLEFANGGAGALSTNTTVTSSTFSGAGRQGMGLTWTRGVTISSSTFDTICRSAIDIEPLASSNGEVHDIMIDGNTWTTFNFSWFTAGGNSTNVTNVTVKNNTTDRMNVTASSPSGGAHRSGFYFINNRVSSPARNESSFGFDTVDDILVQGNSYASSAANPEIGVKLTNVNKARVLGNTVTESTPGVRLRSTVTDTIVKDNIYNISSGNKGYKSVLSYCTENADGTCTDGPFTNTATVYECNNTYPGKPLTTCPVTAPSGGGGSSSGGGSGGSTPTTNGTAPSTSGGNSTTSTSNTSNPSSSTNSVINVDSPGELPKALLEIAKNPTQAFKIIRRNPGVFIGLFLIIISLFTTISILLYKRSSLVRGVVDGLVIRLRQLKTPKSKQQPKDGLIINPASPSDPSKHDQLNQQ